MASRMNSGNSNDLNCIRIDPRTGENVWPKDSIDWQKITEIQIIMISNCRKIYIWQQIIKRIQWPVEWILTVLNEQNQHFAELRQKIC